MEMVKTQPQITVLEKEQNREARKFNTRKFAKILSVGFIVAILCTIGILPAFAEDVTVAASTGSDALNSGLGRLQETVFGLFQVVGVVLTAWGFVQLGLALKNQDPSQKSHAIWGIVGGVLTFAAGSIARYVTTGNGSGGLFSN